MAAPLKVLCNSVLRQIVRPFSSTCGVHAGKKWRLENGLAWTGSEYGPLTDLPDWSFAVANKMTPFINEGSGQLKKRCIHLLGIWLNPTTEMTKYGRPAPPLKGQIRRQKQREDFARRAVNLNAEVDQAIERWGAKKEEQERAMEQLKSSMLKPKGKLLVKKN